MMIIANTMDNKYSDEKLAEIMKQLDNVHYMPGPIFQRISRLSAENCMDKNEMETIYRLVESHTPSLHLRTVLRYEKVMISGSDDAQKSLCKNYVAPDCKNTNIADNVQSLLDKIKEMPPEWTLVQLTPHFNSEQNVETFVDKHYTNPLYLTVFNCGPNQFQPFCVNIDAPKDSVNGTVVELAQEMHSIISNNKQILTSTQVKSHFKGVSEKQHYYSKRYATDDRLKMLVKDLQNLYLKEWKCFMVGKYVDSSLEHKIQKRIDDFFQIEAPLFHLSERTRSILHYLVKGAYYLKLNELRSAVQTVVPSSIDKKVHKNLIHFIRSLTDELQLNGQKRHPLILIIDDSLDCYPWEMMDILLEAPVSRLPSVHLAYAIFKQNENSIKNGFKIVKNPNDGTYIINPDLDLASMQNRILSFYEYWVPNWKGIVGCKPTEEQYEKMLVSGEIFAYNGHGSGSHFFPLHKIERLRINAIVLLFGCGSTKMNVVGPQSEMYSAYQTYLIACSPCIIGSLWEITDLDTDILTTELLSLWISNSTKVHWKHLDKSVWKKGIKVDFANEKEEDSQAHPNEPELLRALSTTKKSNLLSFYITKAAMVARGIPVKIVSK